MSVASLYGLISAKVIKTLIGHAMNGKGMNFKRMSNNMKIKMQK